jgi:serine/threonine protein kinase
MPAVALTDVPTRLGRYQLRYRIALGGMGGVYLAKAVGAGGVDKVVAVKLLHAHLAGDEAMGRMFLDEARIASAINHVNVCTVFDFGEQEGLRYLVMEYLEGEPLDRVLRALVAGVERHPQHQLLVARLLVDCAEGLHAAHELTGADDKSLEVVHRDVSPHNLFVTYDGTAKVVDFGIARAKERSSSTEAGTFKGKFEYAAPEQIVGQTVDRRADVWALGVCLWELVTGQRLFQREDLASTGRAVLDDVVALPSALVQGVPDGLDAVTRKALQRDPARRYATAREFGRALRDVLGNSGVSIDAPMVGEWLEALFPGDHVKRQTLAQAVRRCVPEDPLETVPQALKVGGTGTSVKRQFRGASSPGNRQVQVTRPVPASPNRDAEPTRARRNPLLDAPRASGSSASQETVSDLAAAGSSGSGQSRSWAPALVSLLALGMVGAGAAWWFLEKERAEETVVATVLPTSTAPARPVVRVELPRPLGVAGLEDAGEAPPAEGVDEGAMAAGPDVPSAQPRDAGVWDAQRSQPVEAAEVTGEQVDVGVNADRPAKPAVGPSIDAGSRSRPVVAALPKPRAPAPAPLPGPAVVPAPPVVDLPGAGRRGGGRVIFRTPGGAAEIFIDGKPMGQTPKTLDVAAGAHTFELKASGFEFGGPQQLRVQAGGEYNVEIDMR